MRTKNCSFGLLEEKSPWLSSIVVICGSAAAVELAAAIVTLSVLAALASTPVGEKQFWKAPEVPARNSSPNPLRTVTRVSPAP